MNKFKFVAIAIVVSWMSFYAPTLNAEGTTPYGASHTVNKPSATSLIVDADIENRLIQMSGLVEMKYTKAVQKSINQYLRNYNGTQRILKRSSMYFPLFDQYLIDENMPEELKYLAVVESGLNPRARSKAGAVGLWQFMRGTGRMMGLKINRTVDQRSDPNMSTKAAVNYLKQLYTRFGDWGLVLAAYNSGPGRVSSAIRKANSTNFWDIKKYLPRETRNYVPAFIAVSYLMNYHQLHNIEPVQEERSLVYTSSTLIYDQMSLKEISKISGTSIENVKALNPSYLKGYIPASKKGHYIILPQVAMVQFLQAQYGEDFMNEINRGDQPVVWLDINPILGTVGRSIKTVEYLPILTISSCGPNKQNEPIKIKNVGIVLNQYRGRKISLYRMKKRESLTDIARKHDNVDLEDLLTWNNFTHQNPPRPGMVIKILE